MGGAPQKAVCRERIFRRLNSCPGSLQPPFPPHPAIWGLVTAAPGTVAVLGCAASPGRGERLCSQAPLSRSAAPQHAFRLLLAGARNQLPHFTRAGDWGEASAVLFSSLRWSSRKPLQMEVVRLSVPVVFAPPWRWHI